MMAYNINIIKASQEYDSLVWPDRFFPFYFVVRKTEKTVWLCKTRNMRVWHGSCMMRPTIGNQRLQDIPSGQK